MICLIITWNKFTWYFLDVFHFDLQWISTFNTLYVAF
jgi:hypothetical protein